MKVKLKLDKAALQGFFLNHGEKIVFSLVIVCFLLFVYSAVNGEVWPSKPEDLSTVAKAAVKRVNDTPADKYPLPVTPYSVLVPKTFTPIKSQWYQWLAPIFPLPHKQAMRERPEVFPLEKLQANTSCGAFAMRDIGGSGTSNRGQRWVVITGLLPFAKQRDAYLEALKGLDAKGNSTPGQTEPPVWVYYYVQRQELKSDDQPVGEWQDLNARRALFVIRRWQHMGGEVVPARFLHSFGRFPMAFPLGPWTNGTWGVEVAHPDIPLASQDQLSAGPLGSESMVMGPDGRPIARTTKPGASKKDQEKEKEKALKAIEDAKQDALKRLLDDEKSVKDAPPAIDESMPDVNALPAMPGGMPGMMPGGMPGMMPGSMPGMMPGSMPGMMPGSMPGMMPGSMPGMMPGMGPEGMMGAGMPGMPGPMAEIVQYQLFRFFDFSVEPAKRYRYRVRLELKNPNFKVDSMYLAEEKEKLEETLKTDWSAPSDSIFVPRDSRVLSGPVTAPRDPLAEPWGTFMVIRFDMRSGDTVFKEFPNDELQQQLPKMFRGQLANFRNVEKPATLKPSGPMPMGMPGMAGGPPGAGKGPKTVDFLSDYTLLDMSGGGKLPGRARLSEPGRMLWLDPAGKLIVRSDINDEEELNQFKESDKPAPPPPGMPGMMPGMPMPGAEGMMMPGSPGSMPGMMPGSEGMMPGMMPGGMPGSMPGMMPGMMGPGGAGMDILGGMGGAKGKSAKGTKRKRPTE